MTKFDPKSTTGRTVVRESTPADTGLTAEEERVLRMRSGASLPEGEPLGSKLDGVSADVRDEVAARLRLLEAAALEALGLGGEPDPEATPVDAPRKARIVSALKKVPRDE